MSRKLMRGYRFSTEEQWTACIMIGADRDSRARGSVRLFAPYTGAPDRFPTPGAFAPAVSRAREVLWRDATGELQRLPYADDRPQAVAAPDAIAHATRLVATQTTLWAAADGSLQGFDLDTLTRQLVIDTEGAIVLDIAADGHDGLFVLLEQDETWSIAHVDCAGHISVRAVLGGITDAAALAYLPHPHDRLVVRTGKSPKLHWFTDAGGMPKLTVPVSAIRPCFDVTALGSDGRSRLFIGGTDGAPFGGRSHVVALDAEGNPLGHLSVDEPPSGIAASRSQLLVTGASGLARFATSRSSARDASEVRASIITPMLTSPSTDSVRQWLRAEAMVELPSGCALEFSYASTSDADVRDEALRIAADRSMTASQRLRRLQAVLGAWRTTSFHGEDGAPAPVRLSSPLFDVHDRHLWVSIALIAAPGAETPVLSELAVLYPGETLMENLPSIYQRLESQPENFLRSLVGVLESTTQSVDARVAELGRLIDPHTAPEKWLDYIAQWLGLPWDDALSLEQKRGIAAHAAEIAAGRGTRAGLEALLRSVMPETPQRFRVVDSTAEFGIAAVGGASCAGSRLPTILAGLPPTATELGAKAILGQARLPCGDNGNDSSRLAGHIRIDVSAGAHEQAAWRPLLRSLIDEMVPATARTQVRWLSAAAFRGGMRLEDTLLLEEDPEPHLGTDAVTGLARLPARRGVSLSASGADSDSPLY